MSNFTFIEYLDEDELPIKEIPRRVGRPPSGWPSPKWYAYVKALEARPGKWVQVAAFRVTDAEGNTLKTKGGKAKAYGDAYNVVTHIKAPRPDANNRASKSQYVAFRESEFDFETRMGLWDLDADVTTHEVRVYARAIPNSELRVPPMMPEFGDGDA